VRSLHASLLAVGLLAASGYADPPEVPKVSPGIRLPKPVIVPDVMPPKPQPAPGAVLVLASDEWYAVESDAELIILAHPAGLVAFEKVDPGHFRGKFAGGLGKVESRKLTGPFVYLGVAAGAGRVEIDFVPTGVKNRKDIVSAAVDCLVAPQPPPDVDPIPPPKPKPEPVKSFRVVFVIESGDTLTREQVGIVYGRATTDYLNATTTKEGDFPGNLVLDKDATGESLPPTMRALWQAVKPKVTATPCVAVEVNGRVDIIPVPDSLAVLKQYAEGK
jgi:hypothetical protein